MNPGTERNLDTKISKNGVLEKFGQMFSPKIKTQENVFMEENEIDLLQSIQEARTEWISANMNFEQAVDSDMIDYYTYKIKACEIRYQYLLKKAKEKGIKI